MYTLAYGTLGQLTIWNSFRVQSIRRAGLGFPTILTLSLATAASMPCATRAATLHYAATHTASLHDETYTEDVYEDGGDGVSFVDDSVDSSPYVSVPQFDPSLGTLLAVEATSTFHGLYQWGLPFTNPYVDIFAHVEHEQSPPSPLLSSSYTVTVDYQKVHSEDLGTGSWNITTVSGASFSGAANVASWVGTGAMTTSLQYECTVYNDYYPMVSWVTADINATLDVTYYYDSLTGYMGDLAPYSTKDEDLETTYDGDMGMSALTLVPEPTCLGLLAVGAAAYSPRRQRKSAQAAAH